MDSQPNGALAQRGDEPAVNEERRLLERYIKPCPGCTYPVSKYDPQESAYFCALCGHRHHGAAPGETEPKKAPPLPSEQRAR